MTDAKFILVPKFSGDYIPVVDYVLSFSDINHQSYINFITEDGMMGRMAECDIGILFEILPSESSLKDFERIKNDSIEVTKKYIEMRQKKESYDPNFS